MRLTKIPWVYLKPSDVMIAPNGVPAHVVSLHLEGVVVRVAGVLVHLCFQPRAVIQRLVTD